MTIEKVPHMNAGDGENSYANNSGLQKIGVMMAKPMIDGALKDICQIHFPKCFTIADLGCSSGPNTLFFISSAIDTIERLSRENDHKVEQFQVFLNDVPENDFNNLFKLVPTFYEKLHKQEDASSLPKRCFVFGMPGSFYDRLFLDKSLHFIHSSYSVHWLSQVPQGLENNKGNIYISKTSPHDVLEAYLKQYQKDFSSFLSLRAEELMPGGRMVLMFVCRDVANPATRDDCFHYTLLGKSLLDLVAEGLVEEADVDSFNIPMYTPYKDEVRAVIKEEGSFKLNELQVFGVDWDAIGDGSDKNYVFDKYKSAKIAAGYVRAFMEPLLVSHFGSSIMDHLFARFTDHIAEQLCTKQKSCMTMAISLTRK